MRWFPLENFSPTEFEFFSFRSCWNRVSSFGKVFLFLLSFCQKCWLPCRDRVQGTTMHTRSKRVSRCLFGKPDHEELQKWLTKELQAIQMEQVSSLIWIFCCIFPELAQAFSGFCCSFRKYCKITFFAGEAICFRLQERAAHSLHCVKGVRFWSSSWKWGSFLNEIKFFFNWSLL